MQNDCWNISFTMYYMEPNEESLWLYMYSADTLRNNCVVITSKRRHFDVNTSKWRRFDVITTLLLRHVFRGYLYHTCRDETNHSTSTTNVNISAWSIIVWHQMTHRVESWSWDGLVYLAWISGPAREGTKYVIGVRYAPQFWPRKNVAFQPLSFVKIGKNV